MPREKDNEMECHLENSFVLLTLLIAFVSGSSSARSSTSKRLREEKITRMFGPCRCSGQHRTRRILIFAVCLALVACEKQQTSEASRSLLPNEYGGTAELDHRTLVLPQAMESALAIWTVSLAC